jgi:hyperosmotically inducible protein
MKKQIAYLIVAAALAIVPATLTTGCASSHANASVNDKAIADSIKTSLQTDQVVKGTQVTVQSMNGEVQLSGFVDNQAAKDRAGQIAASTQGVTRVYNNLLVPTGR